jgi:hypothetical protein
MPEEPWSLTDYGCASPTTIGFVMDTQLNWLVPSEPVTITASDGDSTYNSCIVDPIKAGWFVCTGPRPTTPGILIACVQRQGEPLPICDTVQDWPTIVAGIPSCNTPDEPWSLTDYGCASPTTIGFAMDTQLDWLPYEPVTITASDGDSTYSSCIVDPIKAGWFACTGPRPTTPGTLIACVQRQGEPLPICDTVQDWPAIVGQIPACDEPGPKTPACSTYPGQAACEKAGCKWAHDAAGASSCVKP